MIRFLSHRPPGPGFGRPEDRLQPVPISAMGPGFLGDDEKEDI